MLSCKKKQNKLQGNKALTLLAVNSRILFGAYTAVIICLIKCSAGAPRGVDMENFHRESVNNTNIKCDHS